MLTSRFLTLAAAAALLASLGACSSSQPAASAVAPAPVASRAAGDPRAATVAFYNVENLFDTADDPQTQDQDFTPTGRLQWTDERYRTKIARLASVISEMGPSGGPDVMGLCEVENRQVLQDLAADPNLAGQRYQIVHFDSPDPRGIDVALLYRADRFVPAVQKAITSKFPDTTMGTRDLLLVKGQLLGEPVSFVVAHWPSRRNGRKATRRREAIAQQTRQLINQQLQEDPQARVLLLGNLNDTPTDSTVQVNLGAVGTTPVPTGKFYNAFYDLQLAGKGTMYYRSRPDVFDQIVFTPTLFSAKGLRYQPGSAMIYAPDRLTNPRAKFPGEPLGTHQGRRYLGGYSDHFPVMVTLVK